MAASILASLAGQRMTWPDENIDSVKRYSTGPKGQVELIDTSGWRPSSSTPLDAEVQAKISGKAGSRTFTLNLRQITASPSVFATAIEHSDDPVSAIASVDLTKYHLYFDQESDIHAFEVVINYMQTRGVNTARYKRPFTAPTDSASKHYDFSFQIHCITVAQKVEATRLVELLALEVHREWLHYNLRPNHFALATRVRGALDKFIIDWIVATEHEKDQKSELARERAFVKAVENVKSLRNLLTRHFIANPGSRSSVLKFASDVLTATKSKLEKDAWEAGAANAEEVAEGIADDSTESADDTDDFDHDPGDVTESPLSVDGNFAGVTTSTATTPLEKPAAAAAASTAYTASNSSDVRNRVSGCVRIKMNGPKNTVQDKCNEIVTEAPEAILRRSTRKREALVAFNEGKAAQEPEKKVAKTNDQESTSKSGTEGPKTSGEGPAPETSPLSTLAPKALAAAAPAPKTRATKTTTVRNLGPEVAAPKATARKTKANQTRKTKGK